MLQEQRVDIFYEMRGGYFLESGSISQRIKNTIETILKKIRDFFRKDKGDPNEIIQVPENAVKESRTFLDKVKRALQKIKQHPKAVLSAMAILSTIIVSKIWQSKDCKKIGVKRSELTKLLKEAEEAEKEAKMLQIKYEKEIHGTDDWVKGALKTAKAERLNPELKKKNDKIREKIKQAEEDEAAARDKRVELQNLKRDTGMLEYASKIEEFLSSTVGTIASIVSSIFSVLSFFS